MVAARPGFTLAEVIVAMTLLALVMLSVAATGLAAARMLTRAELHERALREAETILDSLLAAPSHNSGARALPQAHVTWSDADSTATVVVRIAFPDQPPVLLRGQR